MASLCVPCYDEWSLAGIDYRTMQVTATVVWEGMSLCVRHYNLRRWGNEVGCPVLDVAQFEGKEPTRGALEAATSIGPLDDDQTYNPSHVLAYLHGMKVGRDTGQNAKGDSVSFPVPYMEDREDRFVAQQVVLADLPNPKPYRILKANTGTWLFNMNAATDRATYNRMLHEFGLARIQCISMDYATREEALAANGTVEYLCGGTSHTQAESTIDAECPPWHLCHQPNTEHGEHGSETNSTLRVTEPQITDEHIDVTLTPVDGTCETPTCALGDGHPGPCRTQEDLPSLPHGFTHGSDGKPVRVVHGSDADKHQLVPGEHGVMSDTCTECGKTRAEILSTPPTKADDPHADCYYGFCEPYTHSRATDACPVSKTPVCKCRDSNKKGAIKPPGKDEHDATGLHYSYCPLYDAPVDPDRCEADTAIDGKHDWQPLHDGRVFESLKDSSDAVTYEGCTACGEERSVPVSKAYDSLKGIQP